MNMVVMSGVWYLLLCALGLPNTACAQTTQARDVTIVGEVVHPSAGMLMHSNLTLRDAISLAGGVTTKANRKAVRIRRVSLPEVIVDLDKAEANDPQNNLALRSGDIIQVDALPETAFISVEGGVAHPGNVPYEKRLGVMKAILDAGGPIGDARDAGQILRHPMDRPDQTQILPFNFQAILKGAQKDVEVLPGDRIIMPSVAVPSSVARFRRIGAWVDVWLGGL